MTDRAALKERVATEIHRNSRLCVDLSHRIHAHPELGHEEERASMWLAELFVDAGFHVDTGICNLPTAFRARQGSGRPTRSRPAS